MLETVAEPAFFWIGLMTGTIWAVLLWLQMPGQTPRPERLSRQIGRMGLVLSGGLTWAFWVPVFGPIGAFFCLGGWGMTLLCFMPVIWAFMSSSQTPHTS